MKKGNKVKVVFVSIFLLLLTSSWVISPITSVHASETSTLDMGLAIMADAVGLDLHEYSVVPKQGIYDYYLGVIPQENVQYILESDGSKLDVLCTFTNGSLHILHVLDVEGEPHTTEVATNSLDRAKGFLENYQNTSENLFYGELESMLDTVDAGQNLTTVSGNVKLEVTTSEDYNTFVWSYTSNGVDAARKCVALGYENGFLKYFVDTWSLYEVGSTDIVLSEEEAIEIALENARSFSWEIVVDNDTVEINTFNVTEAITRNLVFCNSYNADNVRGENLLTLYPMWRIGVGLDKFYPGNVYGIYVDVWADTKEIRHDQTVLSTLSPEYVSDLPVANIEESSTEVVNGEVPVGESQANVMLLIALPVLVIFAFGSVKLWSLMKKSSGSYNLPKLGTYLAGGTLVCILILSSILLIPTPVLGDIDGMKGGATIWGSSAEFKTTSEKDLQEWLCGNITAWFNNNQYNATNFQGTASLNATLLETIEYSEANFPRVATVWFDHGPGKNLTFGYGDEWHYQMMDSNNTEIFDYYIHDKTCGKTFFSFISVCMSARITTEYTQFGNGTYLIGYPTAQGMSPSGHAVGMPYAWTNHTVENKTELGEDFDTDEHMSIDGYDDPDDGSFCYLGYPFGSAALDQEVDPDDYAGVKYYDWVWDFFKYALHCDMSINDALDHASYECFPPNYFGTTDLHTGFTANWTGLQPYENCTLEVYGNGELKLFQDFVWSFERVAGPNNLCIGWNVDPESAGDWYEYYSDVTSIGKDFTPDGIVNYRDLNHFMIGYIKFGETNKVGQYVLCDLNGDGLINYQDLNKFVIGYIIYGQHYPIYSGSKDGVNSWFVNATGEEDYTMYRWLDGDLVNTLRGESFNFSFWFYPSSTLPDGSINNVRAKINATLYYGPVISYTGQWIEPTTSSWQNASVNIPYLHPDTCAIKVIIECQENFTGWIDLAQLTDP